jgi:hypothetical protein
MRIGPSLPAMTILLATASAHAAPNYLTVDHSSDGMVEAKAVAALWKGKLPDKLAKLYPVSKWGFSTQVEGGFDEAKVCVVTSRAMLLPRRGKSLLLEPAKTVTTFGAKAGATQQECRALADAKLRESIDAMRAALLPR